MSSRINKERPVQEECACNGGVASGQTCRGINELEHSCGQASGRPNGKLQHSEVIIFEVHARVAECQIRLGLERGLMRQCWCE